MQAIILGAGKGTRTYPLTVVKPKGLLKAANTTIIEHNLTQLIGIVNEVIIIVSNNYIKEYLGDSFKGIKLKYIIQKEASGTGYAVLCAKKFLKETFIVMNGDDFFSKKDIKKCVKHNYCILGKEVNDLYRFGELVIKENKVKAIAEKPDKEKGIANTGLYVLDKEIFSHELKKSSRGEYEIVDYIKFLVDSGKNVNYEIVEDYWLATSYPWNLLETNEFFLNRIKKKIKGIIEKNVTIKGEVVIAKGTLVKSGAYIEGPVVIGENCVIGPNCYIRASTSIGNNSKVGNAVDIKNSIIGENTCIAHLAYIGDSVIGDNVNVAAGVITANLRHDGKNIKTPVKGKIVDAGRRKLGAIVGDNVKLGINTSIYPGRKIWPDKTTLPCEIVKKDIK